MKYKRAQIQTYATLLNTFFLFRSSLAAKAVSEAVRSGGIVGNGRGEMMQRAKFLNKHGELEEDLLQYLTDDAYFKVVGVIGTLKF